jgi:LPS export ABC transporter protein LptC
MSKRNTIILALLFVIFVVELIILAPEELGLFQSKADKQADASMPPSNSEAGQVMKGAHLVQAKGEAKEWELWADQAIKPKEGERWTIERVKVKFFGKDGVTFTVTGKQGTVTVTPDKNDIHIEGDVETRTSNGYVFKTPSASYDSIGKKLSSPLDVEMTGPRDSKDRNIHLTGNDLLADLASNEITINRNVHARKKVGTNDNVDRTATIQSQRAIFSGKSNLAQFFGNVVIDLDTMQISGPQAKFAFDPKSDALDSIEVAGGIRVTDTDKFATSGTVSLNLKEDKVVFSGSPRVVQNGDELVGDQITLLDGGKRVQVSNAKAQIDPRAVEKSN